MVPKSCGRSIPVPNLLRYCTVLVCPWLDGQVTLHSGVAGHTSAIAGGRLLLLLNMIGCDTGVAAVLPQLYCHF